MEREATSRSPMLIATEIRKASVHGRLRKPSTNRSEVVNPTSKRPPTISQTQGMTFLSLDAGQSRDNLRVHGGEAGHRQLVRTLAIPAVHRVAGRRSPGW